MASSRSVAPLPAGCSFKAMVHPEHEAIKAECDPWIVAFSRSSASSANSHLWVHWNVPSLCSMAYAQCPAERVVLLAKLLTWWFASDTDDDDPAVRGCEQLENKGDVTGQRHALILACYAGHPAQLATESECAVSKGLDELHEVWAAISKDLSPRFLGRFLDSMRDHLNANRLQSHYRGAGRFPNLEEYMNALRRPTSLVLPSLFLIEYGLGFELDDQTLDNELVQRLLEAVTDHIVVYNDLFSCEAELACGDQFNLPSIIFHEEAAVRAPAPYSFTDARRQATEMAKEVDRKCVQLLMETEADESLMARAWIPAFLHGLRLWMAANVEWSLTTKRYSIDPTSVAPHPTGIVQPVLP